MDLHYYIWIVVQTNILIYNLILTQKRQNPFNLRSTSCH